MHASSSVTVREHVQLFSLFLFVFIISLIQTSNLLLIKIIFADKKIVHKPRILNALSISISYTIVCFLGYEKIYKLTI